jgi:hypothetical protein
MHQLNLKKLQSHRTRTFGLPPAKRLSSPSQALTFVNKRGFVYFWPIKGIDLPSLWTAVAGDRPVADKHDDPGHITWGWKDGALDKRIWYYGKILRGKATMISLEIAPYFYALSENYGSPEEDHIIAYQEGRMTSAAKQLYEALLDGPLNTIDLRKAAHMTSKGSDTEFNRALEVLQADFKILPVGVTQAGAWNYAFAYDLVHRHFPDLPEQARFIQERQARRWLANLYFQSVGAAQARDLTRLFGWTPAETAHILDQLAAAGEITRGLQHESLPGEWFALPQLA